MLSYVFEDLDLYIDLAIPIEFIIVAPLKPFLDNSIKSSSSLLMSFKTKTNAFIKIILLSNINMPRPTSSIISHLTANINNKKVTYG